MHKKIKELIYLVLGVALCYLLIEIIAVSINNSYIFPQPHDILARFASYLVVGETYLFILNSLLHLIISLLFSFLIGAALGILGANKRIDYLLKPIMKLIKSIPIIALIVILLLLANSNSIPIIAAGMILIPIFYDSTREGITSIDKQLIDVYRMDSNLSMKVIFRVYIPLSASHLKAAFCAATGLGIKAIIAGEYFSGVKNTLGKALFNSLAYNEFIDLYAYSLLMVLLVILVELIPFFVEYFFKIVEKKHILRKKCE